jgi:ABC-type nitrate/sulfonate/bicarbonate transport system permease component
MTAATLSPAQRIALPALFLAALVVAWELAVRAVPTATFVPTPHGVVQAALRTLGDGVLAAAVAGSLGRVLTGFAIGGAIGIPLGLAMGLVMPVDRALRPVVDSLRSIAPIAWIPMAVLWLGIRGDAALFIVAYAAVFPFVLNTIQAVRLLDPSLVRAAQALGAGRWLVLRAVVLPAAVPLILVGARIAMAFAWGSIIAAELAIGIKVTNGGAATVGLGQLMVETLYVRRDVDALVLYMIVIGLVSLAIDAGTRRLQAVLLPWTRR